jgi:hypothetical protein
MFKNSYSFHYFRFFMDEIVPFSPFHSSIGKENDLISLSGCGTLYLRKGGFP